MKFTEQERDFLKQEFADLCHAAINSMITAGSFVRSIDRIEQIVSERITPEPGSKSRERIVLERLLDKIKEAQSQGANYAIENEDVVAIALVLSINSPSAPITPEPGESGQKIESPFIGEITISDLRKLFAHRASRISEDINQGANQLMTLTDFRLALADMRWRIYNDGLSEPGESGQSAEDVESIFYKLCDIARRDGASIEYLTKPNAIEAMRLHASQVCADKEADLQDMTALRESAMRTVKNLADRIEPLQNEIDRLNESMTVMLRRNAELEAQIDQFTNPLRIG